MDNPENFDDGMTQVANDFKPQHMKTKIIERLKTFGRYCNTLSPHNIEGKKFDLDCENEYEIFIKKIIETQKSGKVSG